MHRLALEEICLEEQLTDIASLLAPTNNALVLLSENYPENEHLTIVDASTERKTRVIPEIEMAGETFVFYPLVGVRSRPDGKTITYMLHNQDFQDSRWLAGYLASHGEQGVIGKPMQNPNHFWLNDRYIVLSPSTGSDGYIESLSSTAPIYLFDTETEDMTIQAYPRNVAPKSDFRPIGQSGYGLYWTGEIMLYEYVTARQQKVLDWLVEETEWNFADPGVFNNAWQINFDDGKFDIVLLGQGDVSALKLALDLSPEQLIDVERKPQFQEWQLPDGLAVSSIQWIGNNHATARLHKADMVTTRENSYRLVLLDFDSGIVMDYCIERPFGTASLPQHSFDGNFIAWEQDAIVLENSSGRSDQRDTVVLNIITGQYSIIEN